MVRVGRCCTCRPGPLPSGGWLLAGTGGRGLAAAQPPGRESSAPRCASRRAAASGCPPARESGAPRACWPDSPGQRLAPSLEHKSRSGRGEERVRKPSLQLQITRSNLNGFERDFRYRSVATEPNRSKKKFAKRSRIHHESSEKSESLVRTCIWGKLEIRADSQEI